MSKALQIKDFPGYYVTDTGDVYSRNTRITVMGAFGLYSLLHSLFRAPTMGGISPDD